MLGLLTRVRLVPASPSHGVLAAAAEAKVVLGYRRRTGRLLVEGGAVHADRISLRLSSHAEDGGDKLLVPRGKDFAHLTGRAATVVADVGDHAVAHGSLAYVLLQGRVALCQENVAPGREQARVPTHSSGLCADKHDVTFEIRMPALVSRVPQTDAENR